MKLHQIMFLLLTFTLLISAHAEEGKEKKKAYRRHKTDILKFVGDYILESQEGEGKCFERTSELFDDEVVSINYSFEFKRSKTPPYLNFVISDLSVSNESFRSSSVPQAQGSGRNIARDTRCKAPGPGRRIRPDTSLQPWKTASALHPSRFCQEGRSVGGRMTSVRNPLSGLEKEWFFSY